jgi:hypothetical protein
LAEGVTLTTGEGVTLTRAVAVGEGVTLTRAVAVGEGVTLTWAVAVAPAACKQSADEAAAMTITKDSSTTREMGILDPPACNDNY